MNVELNEEQRILKESVTNFCRKEVPMETVRQLADNPKGLTDQLWQKVAEQGWIGAMVPEEYGGLGLGVTASAVISEEMGRFLLPGPFFSTAVLAAPAIAKGGNDAAKQKYLEKLTTGESIGTLALLEQEAQLSPNNVQCEAKRDGDNWVLTGKKFFVPDAVAADVFVVAARTSGGADGTTLFIVEKGADGVTVEENKLTDLTSRSGQLVLKGAKVGADALLGSQGEGWSIVEDVLLSANICLAAQSIGGAERIFQITLEYVKERTQFGRPVGSFQAVSHPLADLYADLESARSAYSYGAWAVDADNEDKKSAAATARLACTEIYVAACEKCLQAHGGIGFTWEYDLHLYLKRARHNLYTLGMPEDYEDILCKEALHI